jgi:integrase
MKKSKVTIRQRPLTGKNKGKSTIYLDFYPPLVNPETSKGIRREFLDMWIFDSPVSKFEKEHNKTYLDLANTVKAKRELAIHSQKFGFLVKSDKKDFINEVNKIISEITDGKTKKGYVTIVNILPEHLPMNEVTEIWIENFRKKLLGEYSNNTAVTYFKRLKALVRKIIKEPIKMNGIQMNSTKRDYLTASELQILFQTDCQIPLLKRAALFSALTGLRISDIEKLTWDDVVKNDNGFAINFKVQKTQTHEYLPISDDAYQLLGERKEGRIFRTLYATDTLIVKLWIARAGINKNITFHCFRHTYATLLLDRGIDIYTVSKMLGHKDVKTTQIYANISNEKKRDAANVLQGIIQKKDVTN